MDQLDLPDLVGLQLISISLLLPDHMDLVDLLDHMALVDLLDHMDLVDLPDHMALVDLLDHMALVDLPDLVDLLDHMDLVDLPDHMDLVDLLDHMDLVDLPDHTDLPVDHPVDHLDLMDHMDLDLALSQVLVDTFHLLAATNRSFHPVALDTCHPILVNLLEILRLTTTILRASCLTQPSLRCSRPLSCLKASHVERAPSLSSSCSILMEA